MKLVQNKRGDWVLTHRSFILLGLGLILFCAGIYVPLSDKPHSGIACPILIACSFLVLFYFAEFSTLRINDYKISYSRNFLFATLRKTYNREDLVSLRLEVYSDEDGHTRRFSFVFTPDRHLYFPRAYVGNALERHLDDIHRALIEILPELKHDSHDALLSLIAQGRMIEAIKLTRYRYGMGLAEAKQFVDDLKRDKERDA